jgi:hypothetical protein
MRRRRLAVTVNGITIVVDNGQEGTHKGLPFIDRALRPTDLMVSALAS